MSKQYSGSITLGVGFEVTASSAEEAREKVRQWIDRISGTDFSVSVADVEEDFEDEEDEY